MPGKIVIGFKVGRDRERTPEDKNEGHPEGDEESQPREVPIGSSPFDAF
jgi:hypothetical protein